LNSLYFRNTYNSGLKNKTAQKKKKKAQISHDPAFCFTKS